MGLFDSIKGVYNSISTAVSKVVAPTVSKVAAPVSALAAKIDNIVPHPSNGGLQNVVDVLAAPFTGGKVNANVKNPILKSGLELVSNNPFKTAAVATGVIGGTRAAISAGPSLLAKGKNLISGGKPGMIKPPGVAGAVSTAPNTPAVGGSPQSAQGGIISNSASTRAISSSPRSSARKRTFSKRRKSRKKSKRSPGRRSRRQSRRSSRKKRYGSAKQYARPGGKSVKYTKNGQPYIILASGKARFIKGRRRK